MTTFATRSPLHALSMASQQRPTRRRSARLAFDEDALPKEISKRTRTGTTMEKQVNGTSGATTNGGRSKGKKAVYDEEDDGFVFTRAKAKKTKQAPPVPPPEPIIEEAAAPTSKRRKKSFQFPPTPPPNAPAPTPKARKSKRISAEKGENETFAPSREIRRSPPPQQHAPEPDEEVALVDRDTRIESSSESTKIALPFADTPVIKRNKELRLGKDGKGQRRSSLGLRGRRASSLIDSGTSNALPHREVEVTEFYKHIEGDGLSEPRRMKQLLTWCATRAMGEKASYSSEDGSARMAARVIQEELLKDFSTKSEMSDWFSREDTTPAVIIKKPNPRNSANATKIQELENQIKSLQEEGKVWETLIKPPPPSQVRSIDPTSIPPPSTIDRSLLTSEQASILQSITSGPEGNARDALNATSQRLKSLAGSLESKVDRFADGVHQLEQYRESADHVASNVLKSSGDELQRREKQGKEMAGTRDVPLQEVLRALSRVDQ